VNLEEAKHIYFLGIGGIGMSALARYFHARGVRISGYDKVKSALTENLEKQGMEIHYRDNPHKIPKDADLIIYTPAIPSDLGEWKAALSSGVLMYKRSQVLGEMTKLERTIGVAGTHGKTTTSAILTHLMHYATGKVNGFVGGIMNNYKTNFIQSKDANYTVIEADEYDRSFLQLHPYAGIITSVDADHLDIYESEKGFIEGFESFAKLISGFLVIHNDAEEKLELEGTHYTYGLEEGADIMAVNIGQNQGVTSFDLDFKGTLHEGFKVTLPGRHNLENIVAALGVCVQLGLNIDLLRQGLQTFEGVYRRFEYKLKDDTIFIDDYAHHPNEISSLISAVKEAHPNKKITAVFQPHLYSRTRDYMKDFGKALSSCETVYLLPIYPARERPIPGVDSKKLANEINTDKVEVLTKKTVVKRIGDEKPELLVTIGAGDISKLVEPLKEELTR
jgi:UDP-N-acetylmuramate--alanine ligase